VSRSPLRLSFALALAAVAWLPTASAEIYRWVDENGRVQLSDRPPPNHRGTLTRQQSGQHELNAAERAEAQARAAREAQREAAEAARREQEDKAAGRPIILPAASAPRAEASRPSGVPSSRTTGGPPPTRSECERWWATFRASEACYGPYRNATGGLKPGALQACGPGIADPSVQCGMEIRR
jgi:hypothetical protein